MSPDGRLDVRKVSGFLPSKEQRSKESWLLKKRDPYFMARSNRLSTWVVVHTLYAANHQGSSGQYAGMCWVIFFRKVAQVDRSGGTFFRDPKPRIF